MSVWVFLLRLQEFIWSILVFTFTKPIQIFAPKIKNCKRKNFLSDFNGRHCYYNTKSWTIYYTYRCRLLEHIGSDVSSHNRNNYLLGTTRYGSFQLALNKERTVGGLWYSRLGIWYICQYWRNNTNFFQLVNCYIRVSFIFYRENLFF